MRDASPTTIDLASLDWVIIILYILGMILMSLWLSFRQKNKEDYYLAGNDSGPLPIALSTMATQCSTNSLLGAPAFVAFTAGGGLVWLQYELALPLAMILLMAVIFPVLRGLHLISVYGYLERRFGVGTRTAVSLLFQFVRAFGTGVTVYGISQVLKICLGIEFWQAVILLGVVTVIYDFLGGMKAVIYSDVIQLILIVTTIFAVGWIGLSLVGGWGEVWAAVDHDRLRAIDFRQTGLGDGGTFAFWPMLIGGFFLYVAYYGVDQTQAQRELSTRNVDDSRWALFLGGLLRFPLVLAYCLVGVILAAYVAQHPEFIQALPLKPGGSEPDSNMAVPVFVGQYFPIGAVGLVMAGLFAAAMSSLDSTLNSLSALTMNDILIRFSPKFTSRNELWISKFTTVFWGAVCLAFSFYVGGISESIIESINKITSLISGPLLGVFLLGMLARRTNEAGALAGLITGFLTNLAFWIFAGDTVSWLWWNVIGLVVCGGIGFLVSLVFPPVRAEKLAGNLAFGGAPEEEQAANRRWLPFYLVLAGYAAVLFALLVVFNVVASTG